MSLLSKDGIELLGHVAVLVRDPLRAQVEHEVGIGLAVDVHGVEVVGLDHVDADQNVQGVIGRETLKKNLILRLKSLKNNTRTTGRGD